MTVATTIPAAVPKEHGGEPRYLPPRGVVPDLPDGIEAPPEDLVKCPYCGTPIASGRMGPGTVLQVKCQRDHCRRWYWVIQT